MRSLEKLKSGGLAVLMTAPSTVQGKRAKEIELRQKTSRIAEFIGAYRLPNSMFTDTGADVSVDVVVFKKFNRQMIDAVQNHYDNGNIEPLQAANVLWDDYISGHYFKRHPNHVLGTVQKAKNRFGGEVEKVMSELSKTQIAKLMRKLGGSRIDWGLLDAKEQKAITYKDGDVVYRGGIQYQMTDGVWTEQQKSKDKDDAKYHDMLAYCQSSVSVLEHGISLDAVAALVAHFGKKAIVNEQVNDLKNIMAKCKDDMEWQIYHTAKMIDEILQHGEMGTNFREIYPALSDTMRDVVVLAKGRYVGEIGNALKLIKLHYAKGRYSDVWNGKVDTVVQQDLALVGSLSAKMARLQYNTKSKYMAMDDFKAIAPDVDVMTDDDYFITQDGTQVIYANDFLVGNVGECIGKLDEMIADAKDDAIKTKLIRQKIVALSQAPMIDVRRASFDLLSPQIPMSYKVAFLNTVSPLSVVEVDNRTCEVKGNPKKNLDKVAKRIGFYVSGQRLTLGGIKLDGIIKESEQLAYLNQTFAEWNAQFKTWVKANDELMSLLDGKINDLNNRYFIQNDDESELEIHGLSDDIKLHGYQRAFIRNQGRFFGGINGFGVGLGKSFSSLASVQHAHNIGLKQKTLLIVPKSVLSNWRKEAKRLYVNMDDCLFIGLRERGDKFVVRSNLYDEDLNAAVSGQYRKIFMTYEAFARIKLRDETISQYFDHLSACDELYRESGKKGESESVKGKIAKATDEFFSYNSNAPFLEQMGVDSLVIDEAHNFKNSVLSTGAVKNTKLMNTPDESKRGADAQAKAWYIRGLTSANDGVQLLTATPVTNSPIEIYSMLSLATGREKVNKMMGGIDGMVDFVKSSCEIGSEEQPKLDGGMDNVDCLQGLKNLGMLRSAFNSTATLKSADDVKGVSVIIPERNQVANSVVIDDETIGDVSVMRDAYRQARDYLKSGNSKDLGDAYWAVKKRYKEPDELIASPFNLLTKLQSVILDRDFGDLCSYYDFDDNQAKIAKKAVEQWNAKAPKEGKGRLGVHTKDEDYGEKYDKEGRLVAFETIVKADIVKHNGRNRLMLDSLDHHNQQKFEQLCEKLGLTLSVTISAKVASLIENIKAEMMNKRGKRDDGTTSDIVKQIVFCDDLHLHSKLVRVISERCGIAKSKIAIITGKINGKAEEILEVQEGFNGMDDDNVYQLIIANEKAEVGINLQKGCQAIHHLTTGWTPDSLEQRNGRGARQGNHTEQVHIYYYDADGTYDTLKRDMINKKSEWIDSLLNGLGSEIQIKGELSREEQEALIDTMGDEAKIQEYLAQKDLQEAQIRRAKAEFEQNVNMKTIVKQKAILNITKEQMVHEFILDTLIPVAKGLTKSKILYTDRWTAKDSQDIVYKGDWNAEQVAAFMKFVPAFEKVMALYDFNGLIVDGVSSEYLAHKFIIQAKAALGTTRKFGMGSGSDDLYDAFLYAMMSANGVNDWHSNPEYEERRMGKMVRTDTPVYDKLAQRQAMAKKLIESSVRTIDDIADKYDGVGRGVGQAIADGTATMIGDVIFNQGDLLLKDGQYAVVTRIFDE
ncbi:MAG: helicase-related protein [Moraxella sp.]|nr:helicase-related protein [Moraxella sp.]